MSAKHPSGLPSTASSPTHAAAPRTMRRRFRPAWLLLALLLLLVPIACTPAAEEAVDGAAPAALSDEAAVDDTVDADAAREEEGEPQTAAEDAPAADTDAAATFDGDGPIVVGSKNFTEAFILGEMYAIALESAGFEVERKLNLGGTPIAHEALLAGDIHLYPEYTSTGLLTVLKGDPIQDRDAVFDAVRSGYLAQFDLIWLDPAPFNNPQALATTAEVSEAEGITTYSELSQRASQLVIGGPPEFFEREDGLPGLRGAYGGFIFKENRQLDSGLRYPALLEGDVDVVLAFGTDGQISGYDLVLLEDDQSFFTPYQAAPVVRADLLMARPELVQVLNGIQPALSNEAMQALNWAVDGEGAEPADVARGFLVEQGLIDAEVSE